MRKRHPRDRFNADSARMKFGASLTAAADKTPEWREYYVEYKRLKSLLSAMEKASRGIRADPAHGTPHLPTQQTGTYAVGSILKDLEQAFVTLLNEVRRSNVHVLAELCPVRRQEQLTSFLWPLFRNSA
jgi:hypothetical protein